MKFQQKSLNEKSGLTMIKDKFISILSLSLAISGVVFGAKYGRLVNWALITSFLNPIFAIILVFVRKRNIKLSETDLNIRVLSFTISILSLCFGTIGVIFALSVI